MSVVEVILRMKDQASGTLKGVSAQASAAAKETKVLETGFQALGAVLTAEVIKKFVEFYKSIHDARNELINITRQTGLTIDQVRGLQGAAALTGQTIQDFAKAFDTLKDKPEILRAINEHASVFGASVGKDAIERTEEWNLALFELKALFDGLVDSIDGAFGGVGQLIQNFTLGVTTAAVFFRGILGSLKRQIIETMQPMFDLKDAFSSDGQTASAARSRLAFGFATGFEGSTFDANAMMKQALGEAAEAINTIIPWFLELRGEVRETAQHIGNLNPELKKAAINWVDIDLSDDQAEMDNIKELELSPDAQRMINQGELAQNVQNVTSTIQGGLSTVLSTFGGWVGKIIAAIIDIVKVLPDLLKGAPGEVRNMLQKLPEIFGEGASTFIKESVIDNSDILPTIVKGILDALPQTTESLIRAFPKALISAMGVFPRIFVELVKHMGTIIPTFINEMIPAIGDAAKELVNELGKMLEQLAKDLGIAPDPDKLKKGGKEGAGEGAKLGAIIGAVLGVPLLGAGIGALAGSQGNRSHNYNYREDYTHFATGGFSSKTGWAYLHEGERIVPPTGASTSTAEANWSRAGISPAGGPTIVNNFNGPVYGGDEGLRQLIRHIRTGMRRMNESLT